MDFVFNQPTGFGMPPLFQFMFTIVPIIVIGSFIFGPIIATYNMLVRSKNRVDEKFASIDVYLKKRYNLIPNLVSTVKGYAKHEKETLQSVVNARKEAMQLKNQNAVVEKQVQSENQLTKTLTNLFAVAESYPELKSDQHFLDLQKSLIKIEDEIAGARKEYNSAVMEYNTGLESFPTRLFAKMLKFKKRNYFEAVSEQRENIDIEF